MNNLFTLLKYNIIDSFGINKLLGKGLKNEANKKILLAILLFIAFIAGIGYVTVTFLMTGGLLQKYGLLKFILYASVVMSSFIIFITSLSKTHGALFFSKDYETLMAMPIKISTILISKILYLLSLNYVFQLFIIVPALITYSVKINPPIQFYIFSFVAYFFIPMIPAIISTLLAFVIGYLSTKVKKSNIFNNLALIISTIGILILSFNTEKFINKIIQDSKSVEEIIKRIYLPAYYYTQSLVNNDYTYLLKFIAISLLPFGIFIFLLSKIFKNIISKLNETYKGSKYDTKKLNQLKSNLLITSLFKKEVKHYTTSAIYLLNTAIGLVMITILAVTSLIGGTKMLNTITESQIDVSSVVPMLLIIICGTFAVSCTTAPSISLEGKSFWLIKALPITPIDVFKSKILLNLAVLLPITYINVIFLSIAFNFSIMNIAWFMILPTIFALLVAITGIIVNLYFPIFEWKAEVKVIKQSMSVMITMLVNAIFVGIPAFIYVKFKILNFDLFILIITAIYTLLVLVGWNFLKTKGSEVFEKIG